MSEDRENTTEDGGAIIYKVSCGHAGCAFSCRVELAADPGEWHPPAVSGVLGPDGEPIVVPWAGQPILDAYNQHYLQVHLPGGQPPMCGWSVVA